jgi:hypothetical protein
LLLAAGPLIAQDRPATPPASPARPTARPDDPAGVKLPADSTIRREAFATVKGQREP